MGIGTGADIGKLGIVGRGFVAGLTPVFPAFGPNTCLHFGVEEYGARMRTPRTTKVDLWWLRGSGQVTAEKNQAELLSRPSRCCGNAGVGFAENGASLENRRAGARDEIRCAFNVAVLIVLPAVFDG